MSLSLEEKINSLEKRIEQLEEEKRREEKRREEKIEVDTFGSCISRDIFRYTDPNQYQVNVCIQRNPISSLYQTPISIQVDALDQSIPNFERKMLQTLFDQSAVQQIKNSRSKFLIMDLAEERLERYLIQQQNHPFYLPTWAKVNPINHSLFKDRQIMLSDTLDESYIRAKYQAFAKDIIQTTENPNGYPPENIIVIEAYLTEQFIANKGHLSTYPKHLRIKEYNLFLQKLYSILYEYLPGCHIIKLPYFTHSSENHLWGRHPLHYTDDTYHYFVKIVDYCIRPTIYVKPFHIFQEQSLQNRLITRLLNASDLYHIRTQIIQLEKDFKLLKRKYRQITKQRR